jgi:plastocyanin
MAKKVLRLFPVMVAIVAVTSCAPKPEVAQVEEYVPGIKRWAGPYQSIIEPSVQPKEPLGRPDVTITIDAYTSEFKPNVIKVKQGQVVKLVLKGTDNGDLPKITGLKEFSGHGFHVLGPYDIWITGLRADVTREIVFKATVAGEFEFECPVFCGVKHPWMRGTLTVEPA